MARYLEQAASLPVLAQVSPGEVRSACRRCHPERGEPFDQIIADLDEVILGGVTR